MPAPEAQTRKRPPSKIIRQGVLLALNASAILTYFAVVVGIPACLLIALFAGMFFTGDMGGFLFIPIILAAFASYLAVAIGIGLLLILISIGTWAWIICQRKKQVSA